MQKKEFYVSIWPRNSGAEEPIWAGEIEAPDFEGAVIEGLYAALQAGAPIGPGEFFVDVSDENDEDFFILIVDTPPRRGPGGGWIIEYEIAPHP